MNKAEVLREALRAKRRQAADEAARLALAREVARQIVYDLFFLGLTYAEIVQQSELDAKLVYDFFVELKLPLVGAKDALRAFNDRSFLRTHSEFVAANGNANGTANGSPQPEQPPRKRARFGENRWSNNVVVTLSESDSASESESEEAEPNQLKVEAVPEPGPVQVPPQVPGPGKVEETGGNETVNRESIEPEDVMSGEDAEEGDAREASQPSLTAEQEIELLEHQIRAMKARADLEEQIKARRSERDSIGIRKTALARKISSLKLTQHRQRIRQIASELAAQQKVLAAAEKQNQRYTSELAAETTREQKLTKEINQIMRHMDPEHARLDDDEVLVIEGSAPAAPAGGAADAKVPSKLLDATYRSPLTVFHSHRYSPLANLFSTKYNGQFVDPDRVLCRSEGTAKGCTDPKCTYVHARDYVVPPMRVLKALSSAVVGDAATFKHGMAERVRELEKQGNGFDPEAVAQALLAYRRELAPTFLDLPVE